MNWFIWNSKTTFGKHFWSSLKVTLSLWNTAYGEPVITACISLTMRADVKAIKNIVLTEKWYKEHDDMHSKKIQVLDREKLYNWWKCRNQAIKKFRHTGSEKIKWPASSRRYADRETRWTLTELNKNPECFKDNNRPLYSEQKSPSGEHDSTTRSISI